jgi:peptidylprolyl isomerase
MSILNKSFLTNFILSSCLIYSAAVFGISTEAKDVNLIEEIKRDLPLIEFETTQGNFTVQLMPYAAPLACENFIKLVESGYYNKTVFHRVIPGFMIQGGDPTGTGTGGQSIWDKPFKDEYLENLTFDRAGYLAMANAGPETNGSQFFITLEPTPWLNHKHTIFGLIVHGHENVQKIGSQGSQSGVPKSIQHIINASVVYKPSALSNQSDPVAPLE